MYRCLIHDQSQRCLEDAGIRRQVVMNSAYILDLLGLEIFLPRTFLSVIVLIIKKKDATILEQML